MCTFSSFVQCARAVNYDALQLKWKQMKLHLGRKNGLEWKRSQFCALSLVCVRKWWYRSKSSVRSDPNSLELKKIARVLFIENESLLISVQFKAHSITTTLVWSLACRRASTVSVLDGIHLTGDFFACAVRASRMRRSVCASPAENTV